MLVGGRHTEFGDIRPREQLRIVYARPQSNHCDMDLVRSLSNRRLLGVVHFLRPALPKGASAPGHRRFRFISDSGMHSKLLGHYSFACSFDYRCFVFRDIFPAADWEIRRYAAGLGFDSQFRPCLHARKPVVGESAEERGRSDPAQPRKRTH